LGLHRGKGQAFAAVSGAKTGISRDFTPVSSPQRNILDRHIIELGFYGFVDQAHIQILKTWRNGDAFVRHLFQDRMIFWLKPIPMRGIALHIVKDGVEFCFEFVLCHVRSSWVGQRDNPR
jgi:hypothetical protein